MDITSALDFISSQLTANNLKNLSTLETTILEEAWKGTQYKYIAYMGNFSVDSVRMTASLLWHRLSDLCGEKVTKSNVQAAVERYYNRVAIASLPKSIPPASNSVESNSAIAIPKDLTNSNINFIGREKAIAHLKTLINQGAKIILIQASAGIGKTTLATEFITNQNFEKILYLTMAKEKETISPVEIIVEEWLRKDFEEEPGRDFMVSLGRLKRLLQTRKVGILVDHLEPALDEDGRFIESHRRYVELLRVLADPTVQSVTLITSRERLCESDLNFEPYRLPELDYCAWKQYFEYSHININDSILMEMHKVYGGNAKAMRVLCGAVQEDFIGDIEAYWELNKADVLAKPDLKNLVNSQFKRLQDLDPYGFKLLCRLGCYRYQDVPTVPYQGLLCLLWDVSEDEQRRVIESLKNRSLVEFKKGEFFLHPMIREEAIARLRKSEDWEIANIKAAEFWTESVETVENLQDALTAFEAYYQYLNINDYHQAAEVIIKTRQNRKFKMPPKLGLNFWYLGLFEKIIFNIEHIIDNIKIKTYKGHLYSIMIYPYIQIGENKKSVKFCKELEKIAEDLLKLNPEITIIKQCYNFQSISFSMMGVCKIELGELQEALGYFEKSLSINVEYGNEWYAFGNRVFLAFLKSGLGEKEEALEIADTIYNQISENNWDLWIGGYSYLFLGLTYKNIEQIQKSFEMYRSAIVFAQENNYTQVKAKALTDLGELYRIQGEFTTALTHYQESIEILEQIGAKCDLAEAYYQLALTYQQMGEQENSQPNFEIAIKLFEEIEAPRRVERVRQSMI